MKRLLLHALLAASMVLLAASGAMAMTAANTAITNTATLNFNDSNGAAQPQQTASATVYVQPVWGVTLTPATGAASVTTDNTANVTATYALTVQNTGNATDTYALTSASSGGFTPVSVTFYSNAGETTPISGNISLTSGQTMNVWMAVVVPQATLDTTVGATVATVTGNGSITLTDGTKFTDSGVIATGGSTASGTYTTTVNGLPRIPSNGPDAATKTNLPASPTVNTAFTYTITMHNDGTKATSDLKVTDTLPAGVTYPQDSSITLSNNGTNVPQADGTDYAAGTITVNIGSLAPGATAVITFHAKASAAGNYTNTADITYTGAGEPQPTPQDITTVQVAPNLSLTKVVKNSSGTVVTNIAPGQKLYYTVTVTNAASAGTATSVSISDSPDVTDTTYDGDVAASGSGGTTGAAASWTGSQISASAASIPAGGSLVVTYSLTVK